MRFPDLRAALKCLLLLALFLTGTIPQGFMRIANEDGMAVVLCTPEGPTEAWLTDDGRALDEQHESSTSAETSGCLAITLSLAMVQVWLSSLSEPVEFGFYRTPLVDRRDTPATAEAPHQPRAPPQLS